MTRHEEVGSWVVGYLSDLLGLPPERVDRGESLAHYGVASQDALVMSGTFEEAFAVEVDPGLFLVEGSIEDIVTALCGALSGGDGGPSTA